jgi:hypothetical protein
MGEGERTPDGPTPDSESPGEKAAADVQSIFDQFYPTSIIALRRRALLPWWIKVFSYLYIFISFSLPLATVVALSRGTGFTLAFYGIHYSTDHVDALTALLLLGLMGAGTAGYGLLWGKGWGIDIGMMTGGAGLVLSIWSLFLNEGFSLPLEPFLIVPFLVALWNRRAKWDADAGD